MKKFRFFVPGPDMSEILRKSFAVFKEQFLLILAITILFSIPAVLIESEIPTDLNKYVREVISVLLGMLTLPKEVAFIIIAHESLLGRGVSFWPVLKVSILKWGRALWAYAVFNIASHVGFHLLIIPGVIFTVYFVFYLPALIVRDRRGFAAFKYSLSLTKGRGWQVFGILFAMSVILIIPFGIIRFSLSRFGILVDTIHFDLISQAYGNLIGAIMSVAITVFFFMLEKTRKIQEAEEALIANET